MVVLSAAIVTTGKTLIARQFVEMTRLRVEGLIGAFQKLVDVGRDHTFIETETVRYVYQPMEALHLVMVTNKSSNILEDLETLRLLGRVLQDCCSTQVNEEVVLKNAMDIVFAFDEVVSFGHRESVTLSQIKSYTEMDSHEEKLHQMIEQSKINEAKEMAKKKQMELKQQRKEGGGAVMEGFGSDGKADAAPGGGGGGPGDGDSMSFGSSAPRSGPSMGMVQAQMGAAAEISAWTPSMNADTQQTINVKSGPKKGMLLGKKKPADIFGGMGGDAAPEPMEEAVQEAAAPAAPAFNPLADPIKVEIKEKVAADLEVEGGLNGEATCNGSFEVTVLDPAKAALACFKLAPCRPDFKYKVHPSLNKASHAQHLLEVRQGVAAFPTGGCLKWQHKTGDDGFLPVSLACWPTPTGEGTEIVLELELTDQSAVLENVTISFPVSAGARPNVESASPGEAGFRDNQVIWYIPVFDASEGSGTLQFKANADAASMLPGLFEATQSTTRCPMEILECYHQASKDAISFACEKRVQYELKIGA